MNGPDDPMGLLRRVRHTRTSAVASLSRRLGFDDVLASR